MKDFIEIYDNILPKEISDGIEDLVLNKHSIPLYYTHNITNPKESDLHMPGFGSNFYDPAHQKHEPYSYAFFEVVYRLGNHINFIIEEIIRGRIFIHLPSPNPGPDLIHTDQDTEHFVCLYYINDSEGDTIIFDKSEKEIQRVTPKKGRIVFFDGLLKHCSTRPSSKTRAVLNFNFHASKFK